MITSCCRQRWKSFLCCKIVCVWISFHLSFHLPQFGLEFVRTDTIIINNPILKISSSSSTFFFQTVFFSSSSFKIRTINPEALHIFALLEHHAWNKWKKEMIMCMSMWMYIYIWNHKPTKSNMCSSVLLFLMRGHFERIPVRCD